MIASHYAEPAERVLLSATILRRDPSTGAEPLAELERGETFLMLDESLGWAWGYGGGDRRVGYVPADILQRQ